MLNKRIINEKSRPESSKFVELQVLLNSKRTMSKPSYENRPIKMYLDLISFKMLGLFSIVLNFDFLHWRKILTTRLLHYIHIYLLTA